MSERLTVAIVGGGFGGVAAAVELRRRGIEDIVILERGDRLGGVWRANTYPVSYTHLTLPTTERV